MFYGQNDFSPFVNAFRHLLNGGSSNFRGAEAATVILAGPALTDHGRHAMAWAASDRDLDIVYLEFGARRPEKGPQKICVGRMREGKLRWRDDGALWMAANDDSAVIVTTRRGARERYTLNGSRIAISLDAAVEFPASGFAIAAARLRSLARSFKNGDRVDLAA